MRLEKWFISNLDDSQRKIIVQSINDDIIVQGAAGSGKTNLAIHRALQAKGKGSYAIVIFTVALKRMIAYGMQALGLDKERIAYEWAWTNRGFDLTGDVYWERGNRNILYLVNDLDIRKFVRSEKSPTSYGIDFADWVDDRFYYAFGRRVSWFKETTYTSGFDVTNTERFELIPSGTMYKQSEDVIDYLIIDEAQAITPAGWGAFLKSIEETPEYTVYIFCTTDPQKIPPTILNRVQRFNFNKIGYDDILGRLRFVCDQEGFRNYDETISYIAKTCNGCMREALTLLGKVADGGMDFNINNTIEILGDIPYENYFGLLNAIIDGNEKNILSILDNIDNMGIDYRTFVSKLLKTVIDIEKYIIFGTMDVTSIPITYEKNVKYATNFDSPLKYYNYYMDKMLELKSKLVNDDDVPTTVRVVCLQMARMQ